MEIRRMTREDLDTIVQLERQIFPDPWSRASFEYEIFQHPYSLPVVLVQETEIFGYAVIWKIFEEFHIANFAIRPDQQGKRFGKLFFEKILALLEVRESNLRAIQLYQKFGFRTIMKRLNYYRNGETALVMQKIFGKEVPVKKMTKG
jgi:[ribosomal protein S18]-alanine N-acetyltransferase